MSANETGIGHGAVEDAGIRKCRAPHDSTIAKSTPDFFHARASRNASAIPLVIEGAVSFISPRRSQDVHSTRIRYPG